MLYILCIVLSPFLCLLFVYLLLKDEIKDNSGLPDDDKGDILIGFIVGTLIIAGVLCSILVVVHSITLDYTEPVDTLSEEIPILISINSDNYVSVVENNGIERVKISKVFTTDRTDDYVVRVTYIYPDWAKKIFFDNKRTEYNYYYSLSRKVHASFSGSLNRD